MTMRRSPKALGAAILVLLFRSLNAASLPVVKPYPRLEDLPKNLWHELSSPFTEVYEEESLATEIGATPEPRPFFEDADSNITAQLGTHVHMHCRVHDLRDGTVSWVRKRGEELHLLTFQTFTYSNDARLSLDYQPPNDWRLLLRYVTELDAGVYECQVTAHPPLIRVVYLTVSVPKVEIVDERGATAGDKFYKAGSTIELKCVVSKVPHPSGYVTWRHGSRMLNYDTTRGGISVKTDMGAEGAVSRLYIANANKKDSGNYSCALADVAATTVSVHVLNGENPAAMQHGGSAGLRAAFALTFALSISSLLR
ncbi:opioid-binding protein/cell adhesion molecule [Neodiprion pinetum]|uniref:obscurin n=1 Tax=Neodiprion fabricii TaxID=2872261 RepID=UPI001ED8C910|nr:obscurin [Neodiprion fabricii]XP_046467410.1 obscurin [Neodiprion pinetum]XP_046467411.1 obscurin [Neodiprion pinetum]XP_046605175.1 obscurin [Neodiprion virginianus]XP_046605176.1 obscurin [Neodiprion virginianus]